MFWAFSTIFGICEFGEKFRKMFGEINDVYDRFAWNSFPYEAQQLLPMLLMFAQRPVQLQVFGSISCDRVTLKNVGKILIFLHISIEVISFTTTFLLMLRYSTKRIHALWLFDVLRISIK